MLDSPFRANRADQGRAVVTGSPGDGAPSEYAVVREAIRFLSEQWQDQPGLEALAAHLGLSPGHCQKLFRQWCGLSPKAFLQAVTLDHARRMLEASGSVLDTSLEAGLSGGGRLHDLFVQYEAMSPGEYKRRGAGVRISYGFHSSPFGLALVMITGRGVCGLGFADDEAGKTAALEDMKGRWPGADFHHEPEATAPAAQRIFDPTYWKRSEPVRVVLIGTDFEVRVWERLLTIRPGTAVTYSDLAADIGRPGAARAVGSAVGRNPISFVVPCHRVMRKDGGLGGYHWGLTRKKAMIGWECGQVR